MTKRISVAVTGSSGVRVALRFLEATGRLELEIVGVIVSSGAYRVAFYEEGLGEEDLKAKISSYAPVFGDEDFSSPLASSSSQPDSMVIIPASMKTIGLIANGIPLTLTSRAALAILRLGRRLVVAPRETPLGVAELENMLKLARMGAIIVPMTLAFYNKPKNLDDVIDFVVGKVFDALGIDARLYKRWSHILEESLNN